MPAAAGMLLVLVMGATVTNTGSGEGCGRSWPLCNGRFVPEQATAALIEFSHRAITGVEGILVLALSLAAWLGWRERRGLRWLILLMAGTLVLQAGMGAWAVMSPQTPAILATHFGISLLCFASSCLVAVEIRRQGPESTRPPAPSGLGRAIWPIAALCMVVVYLGAYVRHTNAQLACIDWPLCNGAVFPGLTGPVGAVFLHRLGALMLLVGLVWLAAAARRRCAARPDLAWTAGAALTLCALQALSGAVVVFTRMDLFSALAHAGLMALLFAALSYLCYQTLPAPARAVAPGRGSARERAPAATPPAPAAGR
jgi:cytochrome c oxidase assembly protein subunit 15